MSDRFLSHHEGEPKSVSFNSIVDKGELDLWRAVGSRHQVTISVLNSEGEVYDYDYDFRDFMGLLKRGRFTVGRGQVYAHFYSPMEMSGFWQELRERKAKLAEEQS